MGIERCSAEDNVLLGTFIAFTAFMVYYEVKRVQKEQKLKLDHGKQLTEGEL